MKKLLVIDTCLDCPYFIVDDNDVVERWGKCWCMRLDIELRRKKANFDEIIMPRSCPLENAK
jgi:hypothetical protein